MALYDLNGDNESELVITLQSRVLIYDLGSLNQIDQINVGGATSFDGIHEIRFGDIDNDGTSELSVSTDDLSSIEL